MAESATLAALVAAVAMAGAHILPLERATPARAAYVWFTALLVRATLVASAALLALLTLPRTDAFVSLSAATWHRPLPLVSWHADVSIDALAHAAVLLPIAALVASLVGFALTRLGAVLQLRALLKQRSLGSGPQDSVLVADDRILVAVPGVGRGRILVSHAALAALDDDELEATLAHERGHLRRRHRPARLLGSALARVGRLVPGGKAAEASLRLSLERDADEYAVRATGDPIALASAILKAAREGAPGPALLAVAGAGHAANRLEHLLAGEGGPASRALDRAALILTASMVLSTVGLMVTLAALVGARPGALGLALACAA